MVINSKQEIFKKVLEKSSVSDAELAGIKKKTSEILKKLKSVGLKAEIGGSLAKDTLIKKDKQDIDIFVVFNKEENIWKLPVLLRKAKFKFQELKGSRNYYHILDKESDLIFELVPVVFVKNPKLVKNITDFSLLHVNYVRKKLEKNSKLRNEIRLAKIFCRAQDCYGAESYIKGFSGYVLELLVIYFGSFVNLLKNIGKANVIDVEKCFKDKEEIMRELNESKLLSPVILIDPTYKYRNAAASLSNCVFERFVKQAKKFLGNPSLDFFEKKVFSMEKLEKLARAKKARLLEIEILTEKQAGDIAGTKMKKFFEFLVRVFEDKQQKVFASEFVYDGQTQKARGFIVLKEKKEIEIRGPEKKNISAVKNFKKARKKIYAKGRYVYAKEKLSLTDIFGFARKHEQEMGVKVFFSG